MLCLFFFLIHLWSRTMAPRRPPMVLPTLAAMSLGPPSRPQSAPVQSVRTMLARSSNKTQTVWRRHIDDGGSCLPNPDWS